MEKPDLETSVKGIGQGIAGKLKEIAGEFIAHPELEEEGIAQQIEGKLRRAEEETEDETENGAAAG